MSDRAYFAGRFAAQEARKESHAHQQMADSAHERWQTAGNVSFNAPIVQPAAITSSPPPRPLYALVHICRAEGLPEPIPEYKFHAMRKWRADFAWPATNPRVIVEVDGGVWTQGRHTRGAGFIADMEKLNAAAMLGFIVLRYTPQTLGNAVHDLRILFAKEAA